MKVTAMKKKRIPIMFILVAALLVGLVGTMIGPSGMLTDQGEGDAVWASFETELATLQTVAYTDMGEDDPLTNAWKAFVQAIEDTGDYVRDHPFYDDASDQEKAEAARYVMGMVGVATDMLYTSPVFPTFSRIPDPTHQGGLDNPDNLYLMSRPIFYPAAYRVWGTRGTSADLVFQLYNLQAVQGGNAIDVSTLIVGPDGTFELIVSPVNPGVPNWLELTPGTDTLLVRYSHSDWANELPGELHIEMLGMEGAQSAELTSGEMIQRLHAAAQVVYYQTTFWVDFSYGNMQQLPANWLSPPMPTEPLGLGTQFNSLGHFQLEDDQALIVTTLPSSSRYQGFQLTDVWTQALEYANRQTSLTTDQAYLGSDGAYHFVISEEDPGVPNWLDTEGHSRGWMVLRWQGGGYPYYPSPFPGVPGGPTVQVVDFDEIRDYLPEDEPTVTAEERAEDIYTRQLHCHERYNY